MKILHIVSNISIRNGIMSVLMNYYRNLQSKDIDFVFLYFDEKENDYAQEIKDLGGSVYKIGKNRNFFSIVFSIRKFIKDHYNEISIIHLHELYLVWSLLFFKHKKKIILHSHATKFSENKLKNIRNYIFSLGKGFVANNYFACSEDAGIYAFGRKFKKNGIVINNAIDVKKFLFDKEKSEKIKNELNVIDKFVVGHIGNFNEQKNHDFLVDVFYELHKKCDESVLILVGDGTNKSKIEQKCLDLEISDSVIFLGVRNDVYKIIQAFDVFVLPSRYEGLGIVLIEAQSAGIPCVFTDVVPREANILIEENSLLSLSNDSQKWSDEINSKRTIKKSNTYEEIKNAGFDIKIEAVKLYDLYLNLIKEK